MTVLMVKGWKIIFYYAIETTTIKPPTIKTIYIQNKKIEKEAREKPHITYKGKHIRITVDLSVGTLKAKKG